MPKIELPDADLMFKSIEAMAELTLRKTALEIKIREQESAIAKEAVTDSSRFISGKPASMAFMKQTYLFTGFDGELIPLRTELAGIEAELEREKLRHDLNRKLYDVWRTQSANERDITFV